MSAKIMKKYDIQPKIFLQAIAAMPGGNIPTEERLQRLSPRIAAKRLCGNSRCTPITNPARLHTKHLCHQHITMKLDRKP